MKMALHGFLSLKGQAVETTSSDRLALGEYTYLAVYNGVGGSEAAELCLERLHQCFKKEILGDGVESREVSTGLDWGKLMMECFSIMDEEIEKCHKNAPAPEEVMMGSTAVMVVVESEDVVVARCGDSRALLSRNDVAVPLSKDHKLGGEIIKTLAISSPLGDNYLKLSETEVFVFKRSEMDDFLIIGNDGLFDNMSDKRACRIVKDAMMSTPGGIRGRVSKASTVLAESATSEESKESMCAMVVFLQDDV